MYWSIIIKITFLSSIYFTFLLYNKNHLKPNQFQVKLRFELLIFFKKHTIYITLIKPCFNGNGYNDLLRFPYGNNINDFFVVNGYLICLSIQL